jgi:hypothetical protein
MYTLRARSDALFKLGTKAYRDLRYLLRLMSLVTIQVCAVRLTK